jgi:hypothetical protein
VVRVGVVKAPLKVIAVASVVSVRTTLVPVVTAPLKVAPLLLVTVRVASEVPVPIVLLAAIAPPVPAFKLRLCVLASVPSTAPPRVMPAPAAVPPLFVVSMIEVVPASVSAVLPSPSETASPEVRTVPFRVTPEGSVAVSPPSNNSTSAASLPSVSVPVWAKLTALVIVAPPFNTRL